MVENRRKTPISDSWPAPCTVLEFYAIGVPLAGLLGAIAAVVLSWL